MKVVPKRLRLQAVVSIAVATLALAAVACCLLPAFPCVPTLITTGSGFAPVPRSLTEDTLFAPLLSAALRKQGVRTCVVGDTVFVSLPAAFDAEMRAKCSADALSEMPHSKVTEALVSAGYDVLTLHEFTQKFLK